MLSRFGVKMKSLFDPTGLRSSKGTDIEAQPCASPKITTKFGLPGSPARAVHESARQKAKKVFIWVGSGDSSAKRRAGHIQIRLRVPPRRPTRLLNRRAKDDGVVECQVIRPDELGAGEVAFIVGLLGIYL